MISDYCDAEGDDSLLMGSVCTTPGCGKKEQIVSSRIALTIPINISPYLGIPSPPTTEEPIATTDTRSTSSTNPSTSPSTNPPSTSSTMTISTQTATKKPETDDDEGLLEAHDQLNNNLKSVTSFVSLYSFIKLYMYIYMLSFYTNVDCQ